VTPSEGDPKWCEAVALPGDHRSRLTERTAIVLRGHDGSYLRRLSATEAEDAGCEVAPPIFARAAGGGS
jgi:hypothetical protein